MPVLLTQRLACRRARVRAFPAILARPVRLSIVDHDASRIALDTVGIKHKQQMAFAIGLVIVQNVHQPVPRGIDIDPRQLLELIPRKNNIVAVHNQILFLRPFFRINRIALLVIFDGVCLRTGRTFLCPFAARLVREVVPTHTEFPCIDIRKLRIELGLAHGGHALLPTGTTRTARIRPECLPIRIVVEPVLRLLDLPLLRSPGMGQMHIMLHLVPRHHKPGTVRTENGTGRILQIGLTVVALGRNDLLAVVADIVAVELHGQASKPVRIGMHLADIRLQRRHRATPLQTHHAICAIFRRAELRKTLLHFRHRAPHIRHRHLKYEMVIWFKQYRLRALETLPDCAVGCLAEIAALRVLRMCPPGQDCDLHIGQYAAGQHASMVSLHDMRGNQMLPVRIQIIRAARGCYLNAGTSLARLEQQVHLRIVPQRFKMPDTLHRLRNRLLVDDVPGAEHDCHAEALLDQTRQHLDLYLSHHLDVKLLQLLVPQDMQLRILLLELFQFAAHLNRADFLRQENLIV